MHRRLVLLAALACSSVLADESHEEISSAVRDLGHPDYDVRERAFQFLWVAGRRAEPALVDAAEGTDPEVAARARELLDSIRLGLRPDTPVDVAALVRDYVAGDMEAKGIAVEKLLGIGRSAYGPLVRLAAHESIPELRQAIYRLLSPRAEDAATTLLAAGDIESAGELLACCVAIDDPMSRRNYAAFLAVAGELDEATLRYRGAGDDGPSRRFLAHLLRVGGARREALALAAATGESWLEEALLVELGEWGALAARRRGRGGAAESIEALGYLAAFSRRAGDVAGAEEAVRAIRSRAPGSRDAWFGVEALLLDARLADAFALLEETPTLSTAGYDLRRRRLEIEAAEALLDRARAGRSPDLPRLEIHHALALDALGERERAVEILRRLGDPAATHDLGTIATLIEADRRVGLEDLALEQAARGLEAAAPDTERTWILGSLLPGRGEVAGVCWDLLAARNPAASARDHLDRLWAILGPSPDPSILEAELTAAAREVDGWSGARLVDGLLAVAELASVADRDAEALRSLERAAELEASPAAWIRLGDRHARDGQWDSAALAYARALEAGEPSPEAVYRHGLALDRSGREDGSRARLRGRLMALASDSARHRLAETMAALGLAEEAERERGLLLATGSPSSWESCLALGVEGEAARRRGEHLQAAVALERSMLSCLDQSRSFLSPTDYVDVPHDVHECRAVGLLAAGDVEGALSEIEVCRAYLPAEVGLPIEVVPALDAAGRRDAADRLFASVADRLESVLERFPRAARLHHDLARLCVACGRRLDRADEHAARAVELDPADEDYRRLARELEARE